jgi:hypothetical protein
MIDSSTALCLILGVAAVAAGPILGARPGASRSRLATAAAAFHPVVVVGLFYSLAVHMHRQLGGWPDRIGDAGFPDALVLHADVAQGAFGALLLGGMVALPCAVIFCACVPSLRSGLRYLGVYGVLSLVAVIVTQLAPAPFLSWWWD